MFEKYLKIKEAIKDHVSQNEQVQETKKEAESTFDLEIIDKPVNAKMNQNSDAKLNVDDQVLLKLKEKKSQNYSSLLEKVNILLLLLLLF